MKLRHDFAGHYNRPDIFQMHINRAAPQLYRVHNDPAALGGARRPDELPAPPPRLDAARRRMNFISRKSKHAWTSLKRSIPASPAAHFFDKPVDLEHRQGSDRARGARRLRRQSAILERLCADRKAARRVQGDRAEAPRQGRPAPRQDRISGLSRSDVRRLQGAPRGARRSALRLARHRPQRPGRRGSRNSRRTSSSSTRRWRCSSPSTAGSAPANGPISAATSTRWRSSPAAMASTPARRRPGRGSTTPSAIS